MHTPTEKAFVTPLKISHSTCSGSNVFICDKERYFVCTATTKENAEDIIKAVNSYEAMREALVELNAYVHEKYGNHGPVSMWDKVQNALKLSE